MQKRIVIKGRNHGKLNDATEVDRFGDVIINVTNMSVFSELNNEEMKKYEKDRKKKEKLEKWLLKRKGM